MDIHYCCKMKSIQIQFEEFSSIDALSLDDQMLVSEAKKVAQNAYAPYSEFKVGASLKLDDGTIISGSNQENIAYPSGLCAERVALFYAGSNFPKNEIKVICVVANGNLLEKSKWLTPCGSCRQVMSESQNRQKHPIRVILVNQEDKALVFQSALDLLPFAFGI